MVKIFFISVILFVGCVFSQNYDYAEKMEYFKTTNLGEDKLTLIDSTATHPYENIKKEITYNIDANKEIKKIFNTQGQLVEDLVFINSKLSSGIEYFINPSFPFLKSPRSFYMKTIDHKEVNYENIKSNTGLIEYLPQSKIAVIRVRMYINNTQEFYILNTAQGRKIYYF